MERVSYKEFNKFLNKNNAIGPEIEFLTGFVSEDWWDKKRENVIAYTRYYDDGEMIHFIDNN